MFSNFKPLGLRVSGSLSHNWPFTVFCLSTLFILFFSIEAIRHWPPFVEKFSVLLACLVPAGMVINGRERLWFKTKQVPKEIIWVLLIFSFGLTSSILSAHPWSTLKSTVLFIFSGPLIFLTTKYLFESTRNQEVYLWIISLVMLTLGFFGIYEHNYSGKIHAFAGNSLPAGALLILLSASPMILLSRETSSVLKIYLSICLIFSILLIILSTKRASILSLAVTFVFLVVFINKRYLKFIAGFMCLVGIVFYFSNFPISTFKDLIGLESSGSAFSTNQTRINSRHSVFLRAENYFFAFHVFKENPVWGSGFKANHESYFNDYDLQFSDEIDKAHYRSFINNEKTFENIVLAFLVELGGAFTITYFGGIFIILIGSLKNLRGHPQSYIAGLFIVSVMAGFAAISFTFDTLRYPNLNWLFHSLLGLLINISPGVERATDPTE